MNEQRSTNEISSACTIVPLGDIFETPDEYTVVLEMPGVVKDNLEITLTDDELEITGKVVEESNENAQNLRYSEYKLYDYNRKFRIGKDIDRNSVEAHLDNGVLTLKLNKAEEVKPKKIEVRAG